MKSILKLISIVILITSCKSKIIKIPDKNHESDKLAYQSDKLAYQFSAVDIDGHSMYLKDYKGTYVVLEFWASWCPPCMNSMDKLKKLYNKYHSKGVEFIGISLDRSYRNWVKSVESNKESIGRFRNILSGDIISESYHISSIPTQILINDKGIIIGRYGDPGSPHEDLDKLLGTIKFQIRP